MVKAWLRVWAVHALQYATHPERCRRPLELFMQLNVPVQPCWTMRGCDCLPPSSDPPKRSCNGVHKDHMAAAWRHHAATRGDTTRSVIMILTCKNDRILCLGGTRRHTATRPETVLKTEGQYFRCGAVLVVPGHFWLEPAVGLVLLQPIGSGRGGQPGEHSTHGWMQPSAGCVSPYI
jgi:hypothetical protein